MAKFIKKTVHCQCCNQEVEINDLQSYSSKDMTIDGYRNNPTQFYIQVCPNCGYPSLSIEEKSISINPSLVKSLKLQVENKNMQNEQFVNIVVAGNIYEKNRLFLAADYMYRLASWLCIKEGQVKMSNVYKRKACQNMSTYFGEITEISEEDIERGIILIDTYRQSGNLNKAGELCDDLLITLLKFERNQNILNYQKILDFEKKLIQSKDYNAHFISEVF